MKTICPSCKKLSDHEFTGIQKLPARKDGQLWIDDNNKPVLNNEVEYWTCKNCGSTWVKS